MKNIKTLAICKPHPGEPTEILFKDGKAFEVDASIAPLVAALNEAGFETMASCSGHGHRPGNIALADGRELFILANYKEARAADCFWPKNINGDRSSKAVAPWVDYRGNPITDGDTIVHPDGTTGVVCFCDEPPECVHLGLEWSVADQWLVDYGDTTPSRLLLQIGDEGRACVKKQSLTGENRD